MIYAFFCLILLFMAYCLKEHTFYNKYLVHLIEKELYNKQNALPEQDIFLQEVFFLALKKKNETPS